MWEVLITLGAYLFLLEGEQAFIEDRNKRLKDLIHTPPWVGSWSHRRTGWAIRLWIETVDYFRRGPAVKHICNLLFGAFVYWVLLNESTTLVAYAYGVVITLTILWIIIRLILRITRWMWR